MNKLKGKNKSNLNGWTTTKNIYLMKQEIRGYKQTICNLNKMKKMCADRIKLEKESIQRSSKDRLKVEIHLHEYLTDTINAYKNVINEIGKSILKERDILYKNVNAFTKRTGQKIEMQKYSYKMMNTKAIGNHKLFGGENVVE